MVVTSGVGNSSAVTIPSSISPSSILDFSSQARSGTSDRIYDFSLLLFFFFFNQDLFITNKTQDKQENKNQLHRISH
jgi:hypothetical protein